MTTVLVTNDYILADRLVDYGGTVKASPKLHKYKNKFVVYTGERVLDSDLWKKTIMAAVEKYLIEEKRAKIEGLFKDLIEKEQFYDQIIIYTAEETHWLGLLEGKFESRVLVPLSPNGERVLLFFFEVCDDNGISNKRLHFS